MPQPAPQAVTPAPAPAQVPGDALAFPAPSPSAAAKGEAEIAKAESTEGPPAIALLDLNTATAAELNRLRGGGNIGRAIVAKRPYAQVSDLLSKRVLSRAIYERIREQVTVR
ncbi:ComEA family DNA-binding protein [Methylobacterium sp. J-076]|uniref:ComEA family DNA-binding protein n=1 Tax=Methylobacterium sp. J-076 TaxID=2836655 RepID=UPI001FB887EC|nr:helix-hairpin-helix domain-containing protein [Methylobacterium sp. J-076]MCJ2012352.1 helix-hairpin-helix domain-containing protein [Methylobacterium sp. J-076]